jgi:pimeloyl-ACP methyl ester carboxylesterase
VAIAIAVGTASAWHYSSAVLVPDHSPWPAEVTVESVAAGRIGLEATEESRRPGIHGLEWPGGRAIVGAVLSKDDGAVTRRLREVDGYLAPGMEIAFNPTVWAGDPSAAFGVPSSTVPIRGELGAMPAWLVPGDASTWAIVVHGINSTPQTGLRVVPPLRRAGLPTLLITYREDLGAPPSPDGFHHMGLTEWRDLGAAARYALAHGAKRLVLVGYSMGGAIVAQFMQRSPLAPRVAALVLDAPVLDWQEVLSFNATEMGFPAFLSKPVEWVIGARIDADWESLDASRHPDDFQLPILLFHGIEDDVVPISSSDEFAQQLPNRVTYFRVREAGHTEEWNVAPALYERRLESFLGPLVRRSADARPPRAARPRSGQPARAASPQRRDGR